jgi:hypothetical protein
LVTGYRLQVTGYRLQVTGYRLINIIYEDNCIIEIKVVINYNEHVRFIAIVLASFKNCLILHKSIKPVTGNL